MGSRRLFADKRWTPDGLKKYIRKEYDIISEIFDLATAASKMFYPFRRADRISIEVATCSFKSVRGYALVAGLLDELAFWFDENSASPDVEVINALRPAMAAITNSMLLCASSPYARRGALFRAYQRHFGKEGRSGTGVESAY